MTPAAGTRAGPLRLPRRFEPRTIDRVLCAGFLALAAVDLLSGAADGGTPVIAVPALLALVSLPLLRRRRPIAAIAAWAALAAVLTVTAEDAENLTTAFVGLFVYP